MRPSELRKAARDPHNVELIEAAAAFAELKSSGAILEYKDPSDRRRTLATDTRTGVYDGLPLVKPFYTDGKTCEIVCPYCHRIHEHGYTLGICHKGAHCLTEESMSGYYLECEGARYGV